MRFQVSDLRALLREAITKAYEILGVSPTADPDTIKKAYRAKTIALHPDRNPGRDTTPEMSRLNVAYGLLSDPLKKARYDVSGDKTLGDFGASRGSSWSSSGSSTSYDWRNAARKQREEPKPPPPPRDEWEQPPHEARDRRYFTKTKGKTQYYWWITEPYRYGAFWKVDVGYGIRGGLPHKSEKEFSFGANARDYVNRTIVAQESKGYVEETSGGQSSKSPPPRPSAPPPTPKPAPHGRPVAGKDSYKVYPFKGARRVVRVGGKLYGTEPGGNLKDGGQTKFQSNDRARVAADAGRMKVTKSVNGSDHTQTWDPVEEMVDYMLDELIIESLLNNDD